LSEKGTHTLLESVIGHYLETVGEFEFFSSFQAILRANGFYDIALTHGVAEFGRDFIAKRPEDGVIKQYAIQTKAGDMNIGAWRAARFQIEDIRTGTISNPNFDPSLPRVAVLALTGRLTGLAPTSAHDYKMKNDDQPIFTFELWPIERLVSMMVDAPESGLLVDLEEEVLGAVASIHTKTFSEVDLDNLSLLWSEDDVKFLWRSALVALVISARLADAGRVDLACLTGAHLVRSTWYRSHDVHPVNPTALAVADVGRGIVKVYAETLISTLKIMTSTEYFDSNKDVAVIVTYPVRCLRIVELVGLVGLLQEDLDRRRDIAKVCMEFIASQPGASHPISDNWAVAMIAPAILIYEFDREFVGKWLKQICIWLADKYEHGELGLARSLSTPAEEIQYLLGGPYDRGGVARRVDSLIATVILDLASALELGDVYLDLLNEILAVNIFAEVVESQDDYGQYRDIPAGVFIELGMKYTENPSLAVDWTRAPHHRRAVPHYLQRIGRSWDMLAIMSVLRDRCLTLVIRELAGL
jgi:hypothetical protein